MDRRNSLDYGHTNTCSSHSCEFPVYDNVNSPPDQLSPYDDVTVTAEEADMYSQRPRRYEPLQYRPPRYMPPRRRRFLPQFTRPVAVSDGGGLSSTAIFSIIILLFVAVAGVVALVVSLVIQSDVLSDAAEPTTTASTSTTTTTRAPRPPVRATVGADDVAATAAPQATATQASAADRITAVQVTGTWHYRNSTNFRYFISATKLDQPTARTECQTMIADLASVTDQDEMDFLASISPQLDSEDYWFGLFKVVGDMWVGTTWYDQNPSTYRNWAAGYPKYENAICVRYTKDGFKDRACSFEYYFACKKYAG